MRSSTFFDAKSDFCEVNGRHKDGSLLGYVQPVGLVVSAPALLAAQAQINRHIGPEHDKFLACLPRGKDDEIIPQVSDVAAFTQNVLGWEPGDLSRDVDALEVPLPEYNESLRCAPGPPVAVG
jgi:hypothetical protein